MHGQCVDASHFKSYTRNFSFLSRAEISDTRSLLEDLDTMPKNRLQRDLYKGWSDSIQTNLGRQQQYDAIAEKSKPEKHTKT